MTLYDKRKTAYRDYLAMIGDVTSSSEFELSMPGAANLSSIHAEDDLNQLSQVVHGLVKIMILNGLLPREEASATLGDVVDCAVLQDWYSEFETPADSILELVVKDEPLDINKLLNEILVDDFPEINFNL